MKSIWKVLSGLLLFALALFGLSGQQRGTESKPRKKVSRMPFTQVVDHAQHSVAAIVRQKQQGIGTPIGSSFFINEQGYLVTNAHVIREAEALRSQGVPVALYLPAFFQETSYIVGMDVAEFDVVAIDDTYDVAVLKVDAGKLRRKPSFFQLSVTAVPPGTEIAYTGYPLSQDFPVTVVCRAATQGTHQPITQALSAGSKITGSFFLVDSPIHRGSSGSGVYLRETGVVVGIASGSFTAPIETERGPAANVGTGALGYVRPLKRLVEILDEKQIAYSKVPPLDESVGR